MVSIKISPYGGFYQNGAYQILTLPGHIMYI